MKVGVNKLTVVHKDSSGVTIAFPDVCLTPGPPSPVPVPYPNIAKSGDTDKGTKSVTCDGNPVAVKDSNFKTSTGDEARAISSNDLLVDWPFTPADNEFLELGEEFDAWASKKNVSDETPPAPETGT